MSRYQYTPGVNKGTMWPENKSRDFMQHWGHPVAHFFEFPEVQELVNKNDWQGVFNLWFPRTDYSLSREEVGAIFKKYNPSIYIADVLAFFLYEEAKIDFMPYLDDIYVEREFWPADISKSS